MSSAVSKIFRLLLVFSLTFMFTWHFEYRFAYGDETDDTPPETAASDTAAEPEPEPGSGSEPEPEPATDTEPEPTTDTEPKPTPDPGPTTEPSQDPGSQTEPEPEPPSDPDDKPTSFAWVKTVEIVKAEGTWDTKKDEKETFDNKEKLTIKIPKEDEATYDFRAKVTYGLDSNSTKTETAIYSTPKKSLKEQVSDLEDLVWEIYTVDKKDSKKKVPIPEELASIDEKTGVLTVSAELMDHEEYSDIRVRAYSKNTRNGLVSDDSGAAFELKVVAEEAPEKEDEEKPSSDDQEPVVVPITINYDANYGENDEATTETTSESNDEENSTDNDTGETNEADEANKTDNTSINPGIMQPSHSDAEGRLVIAECEFTAPDEKVFAGWNTSKDGSGIAFSAGQTITAADLEDLALQANDTDENKADESNEDADLAESGSSESPETSDQEASEDDEQDSRNTPEAIEFTLYAQWSDKAESPDSEGDGAIIRISYIPAPIGGNAYLSPILSDIGQITFYYQWEVSTDGGNTWEYASTDDPQALIVPTTEETIGYQYRVSAHANKIINPAENSNVVMSAPVTIREAGKDEFLVMLEFDPTAEEEDAFFQVQFPNGKGNVTKLEWQVSRDYGRNWETIADAQGESYYVPTVEENLGNWYRVKAVREGAKDEDDPNDPNVAYSNIEMLVALSSDITQEDIDNFDKEQDTPTDSANPGDDPGDFDNPDDTDPNNSENQPDENNSNLIDDSELPGPAAPTYPEDNDPDAPNDFDPYEPEQQSPELPAPAPMPTPTPTPAPSAPEFIPVDSITDATDEEVSAPEPEDPGLNLISDPDISELLSKTQEVETQPGAHWRKLSVIPPQEDIQKVLESNPFAPLVVPFSVALVACGMTERLVFFRRQRKDSGAAFA